MRFVILTLFPEFFSGILENSVTGNAAKKGILNFNFVNIRDFANDKHNRVDDYPFGGGQGMLIKPQPVFNAYNYVTSELGEKPYTIYMSPRGKVFNQKTACNLAEKKHIVIICGHYEGVDQRVIDEICDDEISIGDFVLTGGEIAALAVCDAVSRLVPGVLSEEESYEDESHYNGLLEFSQYTRPRVFNGIKVPDVLLSGNDAQIKSWKYSDSVAITKLNRPDMYENKFGKTVDNKYVFKNKITLLFIGDNKDINYIVSDVVGKVKSTGVIIDDILINEIPSDLDKTVLIVCGQNEFDFSNLPNNKSNRNMIFGLRERSMLLLDDKPVNFKNYNGKIKFLTSSEIKNEILSFASALDINDDFIGLSNQYGLCKIKLLKPLPYDAYENNISKFNGYTINDLFLFDANKFPTVDKYTLITEKMAYDAEIFSVKTKLFGRKFCLAVKNFDKILNKMSGSIVGIIPKDVTKQYNLAINFKYNVE